MVRKMKKGVQPIRLIYLQVEQYGRKQHDVAGHVAHQLRIQHQGHIGTGKGAQHAAYAQHGTSLYYYLSFPEVAVGT